MQIKQWMWRSSSILMRFKEIHSYDIIQNSLAWPNKLSTKLNGTKGHLPSNHKLQLKMIPWPNNNYVWLYIWPKQNHLIGTIVEVPHNTPKFAQKLKFKINSNRRKKQQYRSHFRKKFTRFFFSLCTIILFSIPK